MHRTHQFSALVMGLLLLLLAACGAPAATTTAAMADDTAAMADTGDAMADDGAAMADAEHAMADDSAAMADESDAMADDSAAMADEGDAMADDGAAMADTGDAMADNGAAMADTGDAMADDGAAMADTGDAMADAGDAMVDLPAWTKLPLVNARTGEQFTLADFAGNTVFVEPMATWCHNCRQQLNNLKTAMTQLDRTDVVFVALSVETNIDSATLAAYADQNGFDWIFAVATPDMLQALAAEFGQTIANPPATPHFTISADGTVSNLITGIESPETILASLP